MRESETLKKVRRILRKNYELNHHFNKDQIFDEILFIFFSWRTPIIKAESIYQAVKSKFPDRNALMHFDEESWFRILESGGKAKDKAKII